MTADRLKEILDEVRNQKDLAPHDGITYCNIGLDRILTLCGLPRMVRHTGDPFLANDMISYMKDNPARWTEVDGDAACARASQGILVVACQQEEGHGHVAAVYPAAQQFSASWGKSVPMLSNIGRQNAVLRASQCFKKEPDYFSVNIQEAA